VATLLVVVAVVAAGSLENAEMVEAALPPRGGREGGRVNSLDVYVLLEQFWRINGGWLAF
jgi:hypothetical protein